MHVSHSLLLLLVAGAVGAQEGETFTLPGKLVRPGEACPLSVIGASSSVRPGAPDADGLRTGTMGEGDAGMLVGLKIAGEEKPAEIRLDLDRDGDLGDETPLHAAPTKSQVPSNKGMATLVTWKPEGEVAVGSSTYQLSVVLQAGSDQPSISFRCTGTTFLHGYGEIDGVGYHGVVVDQDGDGVYGGEGDYWRAFGEHQLDAVATKHTRGLSRDSMIEAFEPVYVEAGQVLRLVKADPEKGLELRRLPADDTLEDYLHRRNERVAERWEHLFEAEFVTRYGEPDRPKTETPISWIHALDLAEAKALATSSGKPVLADFETDWCVWCKVLDRLTYTDAEVAAYVTENFVPVKINVELLVDPLDKECGVAGFPSMPVLAPDGTKVDMLRGYSKPSQFLQLLTAARQKFDDYAARSRSGGN